MTRSNCDDLVPCPVAWSRSPITLCSPESPGFEMLDFQLPHWVAREVLHYETIPAEPRGALSDLEDREAEADLLASPHPATTGPQDDGCERPILPKALPQISLHSAFVSAVADYSLSPFAEGALEKDRDERKQISLHSAIRVQSTFVSAVADYYPLSPFPECASERESQPHRDEATQISLHSAFVSAVTERERRAFGADRPARHPAVKRERVVDRACEPPAAAALPVPPKVKFQIPFPAFVPFPPSPTRPAPVFSLSEATPFPFRVAAATSTTCTCRCACADRDAPTAVTVGVQTEFESPSKPFNFSVSVGTQHRAAAPAVSAGTQPDSDSNPTSVETVSVGTQSEKSPAPATESVGTQSEPVPEEEDDRDSEYEFI